MFPVSVGLVSEEKIRRGRNINFNFNSLKAQLKF